MGTLLFMAVAVGSLFVVDHLAHARGWSRYRWTVAAVILGPLAIPLIYVVDAGCAVAKLIRPARP